MQRRRTRRCDFTVLIPARFASTRLPGKPLADIARQADGRARRRARREQRRDARGRRHRRRARARRGRGARHRGLHDARRSSDRHRSPRRGGRGARPRRRRDRRQRAGRRAAARRRADPRAWRRCSRRARRRRSPRPAIRSTTPAEAFNPNVVKVVLDARGYALYFSRATIPWARDALRASHGRAARRDCRCTATTGSTPIALRSCARFPGARAGADRALRGAGAAARAVARLPDRGRGHPRHARAGRRHAGRPRARAGAVSPGVRRLGRSPAMPRLAG